jgi:hypothetical protein
VFGGILCIVLGVVALLFDLVGILLIAGGIVLIVFFSKEKSVEYEYTITNGSVEVSAIYAASRRTLKKQFDASQISYICPSDSNRISGEKFAKQYNYTSKQADAKSVAVIIENNDKKELVLLELNERCIEHMKRFLHHKVYDL